MAKLQIVVLCTALAFIACIVSSEAEPQQRGQRVYYRPAAARYQRPRTRYLARQEEVADAVPEAPAVTPYPSADELKPAVPFDEGAPANNIPDEVYGPPEANQPDEVYGPPEVDGNELPADVPAATDDVPSADPAAESFPAPLDEQQARLVAARRAAALRQRQRKAAAYRQALATRAAARPLKYKVVAVPRRH